LKLLTESTNPERDALIIASALEGGSTKDIAATHCLSIGRVQQILRRHRAGETFELYIADGTQRVAVAKVISSRGFHHACQMAIRKYSAFFARLELPNWRLVAGSNSIALNSPELAR